MTINMTPRGFYLLTTHHKVPAEGRLIISDVPQSFAFVLEFQQKNPCSIREGGKPHGIKIVLLVVKKKQTEVIFKDWRTGAERERTTFLVGRIYIFENL